MILNIKSKANNEFEQSKQSLRKASHLIKKIQFCNVTEGNLVECINDMISDVNSLKEQFEYFYHKEKEEKGKGVIV